MKKKLLIEFLTGATIQGKRGFFLLAQIGLTAGLLTMSIFASSASAVPLPVYQLDVSYTQGSISSGPLSFGLSELPASVSATFLLGSGTIGTNSILFGNTDVVSANITFGDATWTENLLNTFSMSLSSGNINALNYAFLPTTSLTAEGPVVLNFPLSITGTDIASGQSFEYGYTASSQTVSAAPIAPVPEPGTLSLLALGLIGLAWTRQRRIK